MNIFFRIALAIYAFCLTVISMISIIFTLVPDAFENLTYFLLENIIRSKSIYLLLLVIIEVAFFVLSLIFLFSGVKASKDKKAITKITELGEVKISLQTIENIVYAASRRFNGIKDAKAVVRKKDNSVIIIVKIVVLQEVNIPVLSQDLQVKVKSAVEESSGVEVLDIVVLVDNIYSGYKSRVE